MRNLMIFSAVLFLFSCKLDKEALNTEKAMRDEIYAIHDDAMPKMGELNRLKRQLKKVRPNYASDSVIDRQILDVVLMLENADEGMMTWMAAFKEPAKLRKAKSHEEIMAYLNSEKEKISQVRTDMFDSIETAKALLATLETSEQQ